MYDTNKEATKEGKPEHRNNHALHVINPFSKKCFPIHVLLL